MTFYTKKIYMQKLNIANKLKNRVKQIKINILILFYVSKDNETPFFLKMFILFILAYALSPIDLIPDFIPILGYLDDIIILPALIFLSYKMINKEIFNRAKEKAYKNDDIKLPKSKIGAFLIIFFWCFIIVLFVSKIF